ncbi:hypothetical protein RhoFasGS6_04914 [Rhodococcus fascians]|nr:hypothetical protein [Rhodococcus fascians]
MHRSELGELEVEGVSLPAGPAVLLVRHELITLSDNGIRGVVSGLRPTGFRGIADVTVGAVTVKVELAAGSAVQVGDSVGFEIPSGAKFVVGG